MKTYVYDSREVILTGRAAARRLKSGAMHELVEVMPLGADKSDKSVRTWVRMDELFEIHGDDGT